MHTIGPSMPTDSSRARPRLATSTVEEHSSVAWAALLMFCARVRLTPLKAIGVNDTFGESGPGAEPRTGIRPGRRQHRGDLPRVPV